MKLNGIHYVIELNYNGISLTDNEDSLVWSSNKCLGVPITKLVYDSMFDQQVRVGSLWWHKFLWKSNIPLKVLFFAWLVFV